MLQTIRSEFHTSLAKSFANEVQLKKANYYFYLGKVSTWGGSDLPVDASNLSLEEDLAIRDNILYLKKIGPTDVSLVTTRYNWIAGYNYDRWESASSMVGKSFYVVNSENRVYKCLDNNNKAASTVEPTGYNYSTISTADGYLWKYMYTIPAFKRSKFMNPLYIPVQLALSDSFYNKGSIESISVDSGGSGYADIQQTSITVANGSMTGAGAAFTIGVDSSGRIISTHIAAGGSGYISAKASISSVNGQGAKLRLNIVAGVLTSIDILSPGVGYSAMDTATVNIGGAVLLPVISRIDGSLLSVKIIESGAGYVTAPTLTLTSSPLGSGAYGNAHAIVECVVFGGEIKQVLIKDPGQGYPANTSTTISVSGDGTGAELLPVVYNGAIIDVVTENSGSGYTFANLLVIGSGTGASLSATVGNSDYFSDQSVVEQTATPGAIYAVQVTNGGVNYTAAATVTITGDGVGATANATVVNGVVVDIKMTNFGSGYTRATVTVTDVTRLDIAGQQNCVASIVKNPYGGHGHNAVEELNASTVSISYALRSDAKLNALAQDYRQYGILKNPTALSTGKFVTADSEIIAYAVTLSSVVGLSKDAVVKSGIYTYRVVDIAGTTVHLQPMGEAYSQPSNSITTENGSSSYSVLAVLSAPASNKYSGSLLMLSNEVPFEFTSEQGIAFKTYIKL